MPEKHAEHQFILSVLPPTPGQRRLALAIALTLLITFALTAPFRTIQLPKSDAFIAAFQTMLFVNDLITATLLFAQFSIQRAPSLLVLASGYLFTSLIAIPYALTFPGLFSPMGLFDAGYQSAGWLYLFWHAGLPLTVIAYALLKGNDRRSSTRHRSTRVPIGLGIIVVIAFVCGLTWAAILANDVLPLLFLDAIQISPFGRQVSATVGLLSVVALVFLWQRRRSMLDLWLMVVLWAWLLEIAFFVLLTALRFSLAFYASRMFALVTASIVLLVLLSQTTTLYARLARSVVVQRREHEGRRMAIDVISASIAHEMSQPIGAVMASAEAASLWLEKTPPDINRARASVDRIAIDGRRASDVVASVRAMFQKDSVGKRLLDVNDLVREVLAVEDGELRRYKVWVKADLAETLSPVLCDRLQLQQVILNLIMNAIEAMSSVTSRSRMLRVKSENRGSNEVQITIEDSGAGIHQKNIGQIFEPFFTTKSRGMGLGLWICRTIIENHNGQLKAWSSIDRGSAFRIILPAGAQ
jgi:signal transduction histidine kinase